MRFLVKISFIISAAFILGLSLSGWHSAAAQSKKSISFTPQAVAVSTTVVISQVYGGAGCGTAGCSTYQNDYIELFNRSNAPVSLNGYSVQYNSATGAATWQVTALPNVTLQSGQYYLVAESFGANGVNPLPTPDTTGTIAMSATAGKVALVSSTTALTGACPTGAPIVDLVGYGATASCFETAVAPAPSTTTADVRAGSGRVDTDNNSTDFTATTPNPRNTSSPALILNLIISEFRLRGVNGALDEFIEIYNVSSSNLTVSTTDGSAGFALVASDGGVRCTIPNATIIPGRGHYLCANNTTTTGYSLGSYPAGSGSTATPNATFTTDIPDNAGLAIFNTATAANFTLANRLDAVGSTTEANTLYKEGTGYPTLSTSNNSEYSLFRKVNVSTGLPTDTNNNETDFTSADTNGTNLCNSTVNFTCQRLGAPGPENLSSPNIKTGTQIQSAQLDPTVAQSSPPNRVRDYNDGANSSPTTNGTLLIRRTFTNNTGAAITRLRFRVIDITTFPSPQGTADLRAINSTTGVVSTMGGPVTVQGTTLEEPPAQPNGGGFNSSLSANTIQTATPLANGASIAVTFRLGVEQPGAFRFFINVEALP
jgi:hypothetical protein